jgi:hypothetical protein
MIGFLDRSWTPVELESVAQASYSYRDPFANTCQDDVADTSTIEVFRR